LCNNENIVTFSLCAEYIEKERQLQKKPLRSEMLTCCSL